MRINWSRSEIILVCDLVAKNEWKELRPEDERLIRLSEYLRSRSEHATAARDQDFRNANSVSRKSADIMTAHPSYPRKPTKGGITTHDVVKEFMLDPKKMHALAKALRHDPDTQA